MVRTNQVFQLLLLCALAASVSACNSTGSTSSLSTKTANGASGGLRLVQTLPPPENTSGGTEQPLMPGDVLSIEVFQADQLSRTTQVDARGRIALPLIGTVAAGGKTQRELEQELKTLYGTRYLQNPEITVFLKESVGQRVTVDGEVAHAGLFPVSSSTTLMDAIALAGGLRELADAKKIYVYRSIRAQKLVANYDVAAIRDGRSPNPRVYGGDVVMVFTSKSLVAINNLKDALGLSARVAAGLAVVP